MLRTTKESLIGLKFFYSPLNSWGNGHCNLYATFPTSVPESCGFNNNNKTILWSIQRSTCESRHCQLKLEDFTAAKFSVDASLADGNQHIWITGKDTRVLLAYPHIIIQNLKWHENETDKRVTSFQKYYA